MAQIEGFKELSRKLSKMGEAAGGKALQQAARLAMKPAKDKAKANAPVGDYTTGRTYKGNLKFPGYAKRNIVVTSRLTPDKKTVNVKLGVRKEAFYAINFIEFGTSRIPKRPWLEPAFRSSIPQINARLKEQLKKKIDKATK